MKPISIRSGSVKVRVYCVPSAGKKRWEIRWGFGGKIHRRKRTSKKRALELAEEKAALIASGHAARLRMTEPRALMLEAAEEALKPTGKTVLQAAMEERARFDKKETASGIMVADLVKRFLEGKAAQGLSAYHGRDLQQRLSRFAGDFQVAASRLSGPAIEQWLNGLTDTIGAKRKPEKAARSLAPRTWNNYRAAVAGLLDYAQKTGALPAAAALLEGAQPRRLKKRRPLIYTPPQMRLLLTGATEKLQPALALGAFAGIRSEEIVRLEWADFVWDGGYVLLREHITKTKHTRQVPLSDNLRAWLAPWKELGSGKVCRYKDAKSLSGMKWALARRLGLKWQRNALRKSFISYRLAIVRDVAQVALEAGNSPGQIHAHYLDLVTPAAAAEWFGISPATSSSGLLALRFK